MKERVELLVANKKRRLIIIDQQLTVYGEKGLGFFVFVFHYYPEQLPMNGTFHNASSFNPPLTAWFSEEQQTADSRQYACMHNGR